MLISETLPFIVKNHALTQPDKIAIISGDSRTSYEKLGVMIDSVRFFLEDKGVNQGDFVVISSVMKAEFIAAYLAVKCLRAVVVPISKNASQEEAAEIVKRVNAKIFLTDNPLYKNISNVQSLRASADKSVKITQLENFEIPDSEITEILFTSGTTGRPKGAMLSQKAIASSIYNTSSGIDMKGDDILLLPLPLNHSYGLRVMRAALYLGETLVLQNGFSFARETVRNIQENHCNSAALVNAGLELLRQQMGSNFLECFKNLRYIEFSAGSVPEHTRLELRENLPGVRLHNTWGSTETGGALFLEFSCCYDEKLKSAGRAINDIQAEIIDTRLALRGSCLMSGYYDDEKLTSEFLKNGLLLTNDLAEIDSDGYVYINGRVDDIINVGGEKISPYDIERIISGLPGIRECACIGVHDSILGEKPALFIVSEGQGYDIKQIESELRKKGNALMIPSEYINLENLPKNEMGKLDRKKLRDIFKSRNESENIADKFINLIMTRRSVRTFTNQDIQRETLEKILQAGITAPSGHNSQTWRFTVLTDNSKISELKETAKRIASLRNTLFYGFNNPKALIIISNDKRNPDGIMDSSAAAENILLASHALGLGACWISALRYISDEPEIRKLLNSMKIPQTHIAYITIGLGYMNAIPKTPVKNKDVIYFA